MSILLRQVQPDIQKDFDVCRRDGTTVGIPGRRRYVVPYPPGSKTLPVNRVID
jgi:hypothetical protein